MSTVPFHPQVSPRSERGLCSASTWFRVAALGLLTAITACDDGGSSFVPPGAGPQLDVSFDAQTAVDAGVASMRGTSLFDFDGDGRVDLAALDANGDVVISLAQADGVFVAAQTLTTVVNTGLMGADDVDLDGDQDLFAYSPATGAAQVLRNDGSGTFVLDVAFSLGADLTDFVFVDLDGDGAAEIVAADFSQTSIRVFQAVGDGSYLTPRALTIPGGRSTLVGGLAEGDFDGDGDRDFGFADPLDLEFVAVIGDGLGGAESIVRFSGSSTPFSTTAFDIDGDGFDELIGVDALQNEVSVFDVMAATTRQTLTVPGLPVAVTVGDVVGDDLPDLVVALAEFESVAVAEGIPGFAGGVEFAQPDRRSFVSGSPFQCDLVDLDQDGRNDLAVASLGSSEVDVFFGLADGSLSGGEIVQVPSLADVNLVGVGRFDPTGTYQVVTGMIGVAGLVFVDYAGDFEGTVATLPLSYVSTTELPGDDLTDLVVSVANGVQLLRNVTMPGDFSPQFETVGGGNVINGFGLIESKAADVNGDGVLDIVAAVTSEARVAVRLGAIVGGELVFDTEPALSVPVSGEPAGLTVGDFDGNGVPEIAVTRVRDARLSVLSVNAGALQVDIDFPTAFGPTFLQSGDLDGDGDDELVVSETISDQVSVLDSDGAGGFDIMAFAAGDDPTALILQDLSNDGNPDLVLTEFRGNRFRVLLGDGQGGFSSSMEFTGPSRSFSAALGDSNGDGLDDLLVGGLSIGGYGLFRNTSTEIEEGAASAISAPRP